VAGSIEFAIDPFMGARVEFLECTPDNRLRDPIFASQEFGATRTSARWCERNPLCCRGSCVEVLVELPCGSLHTTFTATNSSFSHSFLWPYAVHELRQRIWFTKGFDTADLKEAKALLDELSV
jgi:hypothetical protein